MTSTQAISNTTKVGERISFIQEGGQSPDSKPLYRGETSYDGFNTPLGDVNPTYIPSRDRPNSWDIVDVTQGSEGLPTSGFTSRVNDKLYKKWRSLISARCPINIYAKKDDCGRKDDLNSWQFINIYLDARFTDFTDSVLNPLQGDDQATVELTGSITALKELLVFPISFQEFAGDEILADVLDIFYSGVQSCGGRCGERKDDCFELYALTALNAASLGLSSQLVFSIDNKQTWTALDIPTLGGVAANAMGDAGSHIIVISENEAAHNYITFADAKAGLTSGWVKVTSGYVALQSPLSIYVKSPEEIFMGGNNGYAYKLQDATASPTILTDGSIVSDDLTQVSGYAATVVFAGDSGKVLVSTNDGDSLTERAVTVNGVVLTDNITALAVTSENAWIIGMNGKVYYTVDYGVTYTEKSIKSGISVINSIRFEPYSQIGYMAVEDGGSAVVYRSFDSGYSWHKTAPSIQGLPTAVRINVVAPCGANEVAAGGRVSAGGDGVLAVAL